MSRAPTSPCKDCPDREVGCHGGCEKYKEYRAALEAHKEQRAGARAGAIDANGYDIERRARMLKRRRNGR